MTVLNRMWLVIHQQFTLTVNGILLSIAKLRIIMDTKIEYLGNFYYNNYEIPIPVLD